jgi:hypothetical protein
LKRLTYDREYGLADSFVFMPFPPRGVRLAVDDASTPQQLRLSPFPKSTNQSRQSVSRLQIWG